MKQNSGHAESSGSPCSESRDALDRVAECNRRRRNIIILGIVLLIGFFMPLVETTEWGVKAVFVNIEPLWHSIPWQSALALVYPLLAGVGVILLGALVRGRWRAAGLLIAIGGFITLLICWEEYRQRMSDILHQVKMPVAWAMLLSVTGSVGIFAGSRARWYRPRDPVAAIIGVTGAGLYLLYLLLPVLPVELGRLPVLSPFMAMNDERTMIIGVSGVVSLMCVVAASVMCLINIPGRRARSARSLAGTTFGLLVAATIVSGVGFAANLLYAACRSGEVTRVREAVALLVLLAKFAAWIGGLLLLLPVGLTDMVVGPSLPGGEAAPAGAGADPMSRLDKLRELRNAGMISYEEYTKRREEIISQL